MSKIIEILQEIRPEFDFTKSEDFIGDGYLDSFDLISAVSSVEQEYGIKIRGTDIIPDNFRNLDAMKSLLQGYGVKDEI